MDDTLGLWTLYPVCIYVRHDVMADFFFTRFCHIVINVGYMLFHLIDLLLGDRKPQLHLRLRQSDPQPSPGAELHIG